MAIKLSEVFEFINKMAAEQQDPGAQAMAAAAQAAAPPGGIPLPKPIEQPSEEGGENMVPEEKLQAEKEKLETQRRAELEKKENEIRGLQHELDLERVERQKAIAENELKEKSRQQEEQFKQEREKLDAERQKLEQDKALQSNTQQAELIKHQADMERETSKQVADIAQQKAKAIEDIAKQNAQQYVKTTQQAQQQTNRYFADQQKKFKEDNPTMSTALQNQIGNAVSAAKSVANHHRKIAAFIPVPGVEPIKKKASAYDSFDPNPTNAVNNTTTTQPTQPTQQDQNTQPDQPSYGSGSYGDFDPARLNTPPQQPVQPQQPQQPTQGVRNTTRPVHRVNVNTPNAYTGQTQFSPSNLGVSVTRGFFESPQRISELATKYQYTNPFINQSLQYSYDKRAAYLAAAYNAMNQIARSNPQIKDNYTGKEQRDVNFDVHTKMLRDYMQTNPNWRDEFTTALQHLEDEANETEKNKELLAGDRGLRNSLARYRLLTAKRMTPVGITSFRDVDRRNKLREDEAIAKVTAADKALRAAKATGDKNQIRQAEEQVRLAEQGLNDARWENAKREEDEALGRTSVPISKLEILMNGGKAISDDMDDTRTDLPNADYYIDKAKWRGLRRSVQDSWVEKGIDGALVWGLGGAAGLAARGIGALTPGSLGDYLSDNGKKLTDAAGDTWGSWFSDGPAKTHGITSSIAGELDDFGNRYTNTIKLRADHPNEKFFNGTMQNYENNKSFDEILNSYDLTEEEKKAIRDDLDIPESALMEAFKQGGLDAAELALMLGTGGVASTILKTGGKGLAKVAPSLSKLPLVEKSLAGLKAFRAKHPLTTGATSFGADMALFQALPSGDAHPFISQGQGRTISNDTSEWLNQSNNMMYDPVKKEYVSRYKNNKVTPYYGVFDRLDDDKLTRLHKSLQELLNEDSGARSYSPLRMQFDAVDRVLKERSIRRAEEIERLRSEGKVLDLNDVTIPVPSDLQLEKNSSADDIYRRTARGRNMGWGSNQLFSPYFNYNKYRQNWIMNKLESAAPWIKMLTGGAVDLDPDLSSLARTPKEPIDPTHMASVVLNPYNDPTLRTRSGPVSNAYANLTNVLKYKAGFDTPKQTTIPNAGSNLYSQPRIN